MPEDKPWEIVISSKKCPEKGLMVDRSHFCRLTGGSCKYDLCPKKPGPED